MLDKKKQKAFKRIKEEFSELNKNPIINIGVTVGLSEDDNIFEYKKFFREKNSVVLFFKGSKRYCI